MARSFFNTRNDAELYTGSAAFSAQISATPEAFGITSEIASGYAALDAVFAAAYMAANAPDTRTRGAVAAKDDAAAAVKRQAAAIAKLIAASPAVTDQQKLDLGLSVRKAPSPLPPPGTPNDFRVTLSADGSIELTWKCVHPRGSRGTLYQVFRRTTDDGEFAYVGGSGAKRFTDTTIPAGTTALTYQIRAVRSTSAGPWATFNVRFGASSGGTATAASASPTGKASPKLAA